MTQSEIAEIEECVRSWESNELTRAEVLERLLELPTLDQQVVLLSKLSANFTEEAKVAVADIPTSLDDLSAGAFVPVSEARSERRDADLGARSRRHWADRVQRMQKLRDYFLSLERAR